MAHVLLVTDQTKALDETINGFFERSIDYATRIDPSYRQLWEILYGLIRSGGKRLRPQMLLMAYEAFGGQDSKKMIPVAAAQELLHFCLLIHDDVIDRDYIRYGTSNVAGRYLTAYASFVKTPENLTHYAHSAAILGGDLMLSGAYRLIADSTLNEEEKNVANGLLSTAIFEVAGGELLDTELSFAPYSDGDALKVARYKTASYTFVSPIMTGASLAGINEKQTRALNEFSQALGIAYQLVDDLLGVFGVEEQTGKSTSSDITEGKRTYMVEKSLAMMSDAQKRRFTKAFGNPDARVDDIENARKLLKSTGGEAATEELIQTYAEQAHAAILQMDLSEQYQSEFEKLVTRVTERSY